MVLLTLCPELAGASAPGFPECPRPSLPGHAIPWDNCPDFGSYSGSLKASGLQPFDVHHHAAPSSA